MIRLDILLWLLSRPDPLWILDAETSGWSCCLRHGNYLGDYCLDRE